MSIIDLAFERQNLLVLEIASRGLLDPSSPGALIRVAPNGARRVVMTKGLNYPTGVAVAGGSIYISNNGIYPGGRKRPHGYLIAIPAALVRDTYAPRARRCTGARRSASSSNGLVMFPRALRFDRGAAKVKPVG